MNTCLLISSLQSLLSQFLLADFFFLVIVYIFPASLQLRYVVHNGYYIVVSPDFVVLNGMFSADRHLIYLHISFIPLKLFFFQVHF